jgi:branched-chain amino acid transport system substrate-binding protein
MRRWHGWRVLAAVAAVALVAGCSSSSSKKANTSTGATTATTAAGSAATGSSGATGGSSSGLTAAQLQWALTYTHGTAGKANQSLSPVVLGYVNQQGGILSFPESTVGANAVVSFVNDQLGGIQGHPLVLRTCFGASPADSAICGTKMANDAAVKAIVIPLFLLDDQALYAPIASKKPLLDDALVFPVDLTTPNIYSYEVGIPAYATGTAQFVKNVLHKTRVIDIRTDNPAGLAASQVQEATYRAAGVQVIDVPVPEPGTAPTYTAAVRSANPHAGDVIQVSLTSVGGVSVYDALKALNISASTIPVLGSANQALEPMPGHLKQVGAKDTLYPDGWYFTDNGYTEFMPVANSNGNDVYVAMMSHYAPAGANIHGFAPYAFQEILSMVRFYNEDGPDATSAQLANSIKTFTGPAALVAGPLQCGVQKASPNLCAFTIGFEQRMNGQWISVADGLNGKAINTLAGSS